MANMDLTGKKVFHKAFGEGTVLSHEHRENEEDTLRIDFSGEVKEFKYPSAFKMFLSAVDESVGAHITADLKSHEEEKTREKEQQRQRWQEIARPALVLPKKSSGESRPIREKINIEKTGMRKNLAFKCNYNDGGKNEDRIGFSGVCSDAVMRINIEVEKRNWCTQPICECMKYYQRQVSREKLDELYGKVFICYESQMLREWKALAGMYTSGEKKGQAMKLLHAEENRLAVLTTRFPGEEERERVIFAVFLIGEFDRGNEEEEGFVSAGDQYRITLSVPESRKMPFWKYFANESDSARPAWASGLFRYLSDDEAVQILRDIWEIKKGTKDEDDAQEMLEQYCDLHGIDIAMVPEPNGALML